MNTLIKQDIKPFVPSFPTPRTLFGSDLLDRLTGGWAENLYPSNIMRRYTKDDGSLVMEYNLAGFADEDISLKFDSAIGELIINAKSETEDNKRSFSTVLSLSPYTTPDDIFTNYKNGVLEVTIAPLEKRKEDSLVTVPLNSKKE